MPDDAAPRRSLFAVWRWPRWMKLLILPVSLVIYVLSCAPVDFVFIKNGVLPGSNKSQIGLAVGRFYHPAQLLMLNIKVGGRTLYLWEHVMMAKIFDPEMVPLLLDIDADESKNVEAISE